MHDRYSPAAVVWALCWFPQVLSDKVARLWRVKAADVYLSCSSTFPRILFILGNGVLTAGAKGYLLAALLLLLLLLLVAFNPVCLHSPSLSTMRSNHIYQLLNTKNGAMT